MKKPAIALLPINLYKDSFTIEKELMTIQSSFINNEKKKSISKLIVIAYFVNSDGEYQNTSSISVEECNYIVEKLINFNLMDEHGIIENMKNHLKKDLIAITEQHDPDTKGELLFHDWFDDVIYDYRRPEDITKSYLFGDIMNVLNNNSNPKTTLEIDVINMIFDNLQCIWDVAARVIKDICYNTPKAIGFRKEILLHFIFPDVKGDEWFEKSWNHISQVLELSPSVIHIKYNNTDLYTDNNILELLVDELNIDSYENEDINKKPPFLFKIEGEIAKVVFNGTSKNYKTNNALAFIYIILYKKGEKISCLNLDKICSYRNQNETKTDSINRNLSELKHSYLSINQDYSDLDEISKVHKTYTTYEETLPYHSAQEIKAQIKRLKEEKQELLERDEEMLTDYDHYKRNEDQISDKIKLLEKYLIQYPVMHKQMKKTSDNIRKQYKKQIKKFPEDLQDYLNRNIEFKTGFFRFTNKDPNIEWTFL